MKKIAKVAVSFCLAFVLLVASLPAMAVHAESAFVPRTETPSSDNPYYFSDLNLYYRYGYGMPNCTAYAYANVHEEFMRGKITLIGCPKLDAVDYSQKLGAIISANNVKSVTLLRMEVPCCGGLEFAAKKAIAESGKALPLRVVTFSIDGDILSGEA